jgi:hypothetical protein
MTRWGYMKFVPSGPLTQGSSRSRDGDHKINWHTN